MLINCIECNVQVSDSAQICPNCGKDTKGVKCSLCKEQTPYSDAVKRYIGGYIEIDAIRKPMRVSLHYHSNCLNSFKQEYIHLEELNRTCPDCGESLSNIWSEEVLLNPEDNEKSCNRCGYFPLSSKEIFKKEGSCNKCSLPIFAVFHGFCEEFKYTGHWIDGREQEKLCRYHYPLCAPLEEEQSHKFAKRIYYDKNKILLKEILPAEKVVPQETIRARNYDKAKGCSTLIVIIGVLIFC